MGIRIIVDGDKVYTDDYSVSESSTPVVGGDTSGAVGSIGTAFPSSPMHRLWSNKPVTLADSRQGSTLGRAYRVSDNRGTGMTSLSAVTRLGDLTIRNVQAAPFVGTLEDAFAYYLSLAGITTDFAVPDTALATRSVAYPGWYGELWTQLKLLCSAESAEIALVSDNIILRSVGARIARSRRDIDRTVDVDAQQLAQTVQAYCYYNESITDEIVYPSGSEEPQVISVNAGETVTTTIPLSASLVSVEQPTPLLFVPPGGTGASVYTVIGDDNLPIPPAEWTAKGGSLTVAINPDTTSVTVTVVGATDVAGSSGAVISYRIALSDDETTYSTLYFRGTGVRFTKTLYTFRTGVTAAQTSQEIGIVVDNPLVSTLAQVYRVGTSAARQYTGRRISLSGSVTAINRRGDSGQANYPTYDYVDTELLSGLTYNAVQADPRFSGVTYDGVQAYLYTLVQDDFENQVFGNTGGARMWDEQSLRWYRIREATITPSGITVGSADDDLHHEDIQEAFSGMTYNDIQTIYSGYTYDEGNLLGAYVG